MAVSITNIYKTIWWYLYHKQHLQYNTEVCTHTITNTHKQHGGIHTHNQLSYHNPRCPTQPGDDCSAVCGAVKESCTRTANQRHANIGSAVVSDQIIGCSRGRMADSGSVHCTPGDVVMAWEVMGMYPEN